MFVARLMQILFFPLFLFAVFSFENFLHSFFNSSLHHPEVLFRVDMLDHFVFCLGAHKGDLLNDGFLRLLALDAGIEAVSRPWRLIR